MFGDGFPGVYFLSSLSRATFQTIHPLEFDCNPSPFLALFGFVEARVFKPRRFPQIGRRLLLSFYWVLILGGGTFYALGGGTFYALNPVLGGTFYAWITFDLHRLFVDN